MQPFLLETVNVSVRVIFILSSLFSLKMFLKLLNVDIICCSNWVIFSNAGFILIDGDDPLDRHLSDDHSPLHHQLFRHTPLLSAQLLAVRIQERLVIGFESVWLLEVDGEVGWNELARFHLKREFENRKHIKT
jgi:hypothetical protein